MSVAAEDTGIDQAETDVSEKKVRLNELRIRSVRQLIETFKSNTDTLEEYVKRNPDVYIPSFWSLVGGDFEECCQTQENDHNCTETLADGEETLNLTQREVQGSKTDLTPGGISITLTNTDPIFESLDDLDDLASFNDKRSETPARWVCTAAARDRVVEEERQESIAREKMSDRFSKLSELASSGTFPFAVEAKVAVEERSRRSAPLKAASVFMVTNPSDCQELEIANAALRSGRANQTAESLRTWLKANENEFGPQLTILLRESPESRESLGSGWQSVNLQAEGKMDRTMVLIGYVIPDSEMQSGEETPKISHMTDSQLA
ncbi:hypothetical protein BD324DRAFT_649567 [Kockovaella imperatae]|uniref:Uncharacterized protein n=1 Tax=Kockovaella imperatae TaxID=4999 RepID=A0A1Y1UKW9_9TREE|nr:hypothetical protein BD324DRAFT_649567 [Kockovaella imperatae]ORX38187.1 hypothetical protein BD324DRAFT_649567 [Kockovaella imperatae]